METKNFATKQDLKNFEIRIEEKIKASETAVVKKVKNSELKILGELQKMREEKDTHQFSHMRINDEINDHENRLKALEGKS